MDTHADTGATPDRVQESDRGLLFTLAFGIVVHAPNNHNLGVPVTESTPAVPVKRGRPAGVTNVDTMFLAWQRADETIKNVEENVRAEVERRAALARIDAQAALARFKIYGGLVKDGKPVNDDGTPYVLTRDRKPVEKVDEKPAK